MLLCIAPAGKGVPKTPSVGASYLPAALAAFKPTAVAGLDSAMLMSWKTLAFRITAEVVTALFLVSELDGAAPGIFLPAVMAGLLVMSGAFTAEESVAAAVSARAQL